MRRPQRATALALLFALGVQLGCGTLIYPERRGQRSGRIDPSIAILDGIGVLLFIVPGLVAFAVDFGTGAIYLPGGRRAEVERIPFEGDDLSDAATAVERHLGIDLDPHMGKARVIPLDDAAEARERIAAFGAAARGERLATR